MSKLWQQGGYLALARQAAAILGTPNDTIAAAILAHWACENGDDIAYPPPHNNPGNLTRAIGDLDGEPHAVATTHPGLGLLYAYATPEVGAAAYAHYLTHSRRYPAALRAAHAGDARTFLIDVCQNGYGTRTSCVLELLPQVRMPAPVAGGARFLVEAPSVNVRSGPTLAAPVVGHLTAGTIVTGTAVSGGRYQVGSSPQTGWIRMAPTRYSVAGYLRQISA